MPDQGRWGPLRDLRALPQAPCCPLSAEGGRYDVPALEGLWARQEGDGAAKGAADQLDPHLVQENHATAAADALPARLLPTVCRHRRRGAPGQKRLHEITSQSGTIGNAGPHKALQGLSASESDGEKAARHPAVHSPPPTGRREGHGAPAALSENVASLVPSS